MGWAYGTGIHPRTGNPRPIGYGVKAICDNRGCKVPIHRGIAYLCGDSGATTTSEHGCGGYFCYGHLCLPFGGAVQGQFCPSCFLKLRLADHDSGSREEEKSNG